MEGTLFRYGPGGAHVAFKSGSHPRHFIFVGGLTDGLLATKYIPLLAQGLEQQRFSLVQTLLSSSHQGWGLASLDQDVHDLRQLVAHLRKEHGCEGVVLAGHSTGCQDAVRYTARHRDDPAAAPLLGVVLQAPVSDREWLATQPETATRLATAETMVAAGRGEEVAFRAMDIDGAAVTARRWHSLAAVGGDDDMFSSDLQLAEMTERVGGRRAWQGVPTLVLMGEADEYVPPSVNSSAVGIALCQSIGSSARLETIHGGNHSLSEHGQEAVDLISRFVASLREA